MLSNVPDFEQYREQKQKQADQDLSELLKEYSSWLKRNTNLREKVRAKHMYAEQAGQQVEDLEMSPWKSYFEDWFAFDYVTIIGSRLFDLFIKEEAANLAPAKVQLGGLVLTAALEPFQILHRRTRSVLATPLWRKEEKRLSPLSEDGCIDDTASVILVRSVHCGFEHRVISPVVPLVLPEENNIIEEWKVRSEEKEEENQRLRFMKEHGASWMAYAKAGSS
ncbi:hypothetical protein [Salibacterium aidingense]|uniref:hypothetical protein n=1 Tax=Salibacterium aidingense TaxID=384933 RepID=UPI003BC05858